VFTTENNLDTRDLDGYSPSSELAAMCKNGNQIKLIASINLSLGVVEFTVKVNESSFVCKNLVSAVEKFNELLTTL